MKKIIKWILGLGTVAATVGLLTVRLVKKAKNTSSDTLNEIADNAEEETDSGSFDLDQDLEPAQERSYVSLHVSSPSEDDSENPENSEDAEVSESENNAVSGDTGAEND